MNKWKYLVPAMAALLLSGQAAAQSEAEERERELAARQAEYAEQLRVAEERMAEAARRVAELSVERLPELREIQVKIAGMNKPRIGITIESSDSTGPVEGVEVIGVTPGTAADDAGLRSGDIITAINDEALTAESSGMANKLLFDFMEGVEEGDVLEIDYLRSGNQGTVELSPRKVEMHTYGWSPKDRAAFVERFVKPDQLGQAIAIDLRFPWGSGFGSMELVELNSGLGRYFGTDTGLLVVSAPQPEDYGLEDGDVIQSIDGREPKDVRQALKILGTYESGETLELGIMRDKKKRTLEVEIPASDQRGMLLEAPLAPRPGSG